MTHWLKHSISELCLESESNDSDESNNWADSKEKANANRIAASKMDDTNVFILIEMGFNSFMFCLLKPAE